MLYGATGFTGRLVAEYLARKHDGSFRWALAGRAEDKLRQIRAELGLGNEIGLIRADSGDASSLHNMAAQTRVVLSTVGPYIRYGEPLVKACIDAGSDYVDITGEPEFVNLLLDRHHAAAQDRGVRIVNCCGFDSIPHDLGVYMTVQHLPDDAAVTAQGFVTTDARFSGGTFHSAIEMISRKSTRPRAKTPTVNGGRSVRSGPRKVHYAPEVKGWVAPFPTIDPQVILRSARALPEYGRAFVYSHYLNVGSLPVMVGMGLGVGVLAGLVQIKPTRDLLLKLLPQGSGPSPERRARSSFDVKIVARAGDRQVIGHVHGGDPGYDETSKMVSESALCLALDRAQLPTAVGVITTAEAMGDLLLARLRRAGITFEVTEPNPENR
ncbi:MAG: saccharopine dehydrogenase NADP-binding domain-containing protein [Caldilineaceae bacterium]